MELYIYIYADSWKAKIYAECLGGSFTSDAYHMMEPHQVGNFIHENYQRIAGIPAQIWHCVFSHYKTWKPYILTYIYYMLYQIGSGVVLCIEKALAHSRVKREDVNYICETMSWSFYHLWELRKLYRRKTLECEESIRKNRAYNAEYIIYL